MPSPLTPLLLHPKTAGDWLQGPYVYALYPHNGFDRGDIGRLFIAGFASSMVFGTIVGSLADRTCVRSVSFLFGPCTHGEGEQGRRRGGSRHAAHCLGI
jgi:hypothetical protein